MTSNTWIDVRDKLPKRRKPVLVFVKNFGFENRDEVGIGCLEARLSRRCWVVANPGCVGYDLDVTHWMPLPPAPKVE